MRTKGSFSRYHLNSPADWHARSGRTSGGSCNGLTRAGLHSFRISSARIPGDFQRGQSWEAFNHGTPFLEAAARLLFLASKYLFTFIIQMTSLAVNGASDGINNTPAGSGGVAFLIKLKGNLLMQFFLSNEFSSRTGNA